MELKARGCIVTGASSGIGLATAELLCAEGAGVLLVARNGERLQAAAKRCRKAGAERGGEVETLALDVTEIDAGERMVTAATTRFGRVDVLVNSAGTARWRDLSELTDADWQTQWEQNVMAPMRAMRAAIPAMLERGFGRIVNVSSSAGKRPSRYMPEYSVAKAAMLSLSRLYADHYAERGVLVNAVCPGPAESPMWMAPGGLADQSAELSGVDRSEALARAGAGRPIGRLATPQEIAPVIAFLCSERASYVAGAAWSVDGGTVQVII